MGMENVLMGSVNAILSIPVSLVNRGGVKMIAWIEENAQVLLNANAIRVLVEKIVVRSYVPITARIEASVIRMDVTVKMASLEKIALCYLVPMTVVGMVFVISLPGNVIVRKALQIKIVQKKSANLTAIIMVSV
jgi:hypothetical protein